MTDIQRWEIEGTPYEYATGTHVLYADHVEALRQAEQRAYDDRNVYSEAEVEEQNTKHYDKGRAESYEQGQRDALAAAVQRVSSLDEAVPFSSDVDTLLSLSEVIAAIKGGAA